MGLIHIFAAAFIVLAVQNIQAQCVNMRQSIPTRTYVSSQSYPQPCPSCPVAQPCPSCSTSSADELNKLILLAKMLIEKNSEHANRNYINAEAIIKRLIDALIYTTLQYNNCRAVLDTVVKGNGSGSGGNSNGNTAGGSGKALIDLDLLNPGSSNNVLDLGLAGQDLLGIGLGKPSGSGGSSSGSKGGSGDSSKGSPSLIDLGLLRPNQQDNVLDLGLAGNNLVGVGLGNSGGSGSKGTNSSSSGSSTGSNSSSGGSSSQGALIDLSLLNPKSSGNVLDLGVAGENVLAVGLGDSK